MSRILVTEKIAERGLARLRADGHEVDVRLGLSDEELSEAVRGAHALIVRSATQVTADVIAAGVGLVVVGRAGIGLDNVDVAAATRQGVIVANAPLSNAVSAAEHAVGLMLAMARNIPQAHSALVAGRWERSEWLGVELADKTLGIIGFGRIGRLVAERAAAFDMRIIAHDPFVADEQAGQVGVELVELDELLARSDFVSLHVAKTDQTVGMIDAERLAGAKPGLRLVNVARGGVVDEEALAEALVGGPIAGAALDVFASEPATESPLFGLPNVIVTPHLGASTSEAQDKAGATIAEQVALALAGEFVPFAVNIDAAEAVEPIQPYLPLAGHLGAFFAALCGELPESVEVQVQGEIADYDNAVTVLAAVSGILSGDDDEVSFVNATQVAKDRGLEIRSSVVPGVTRHASSVRLVGGGHSVAGTVASPDGQPRLIEVDDHSIDVPPTRHMIVVRNEDRPGVIGVVGGVLGKAGINISDMAVGRSLDGEAAVMVISADAAAGETVVGELEAHPDVETVRAISLPDLDV